MILFISYGGNFGGAERQLVDVAGGLSGERAVVCPEGPLADAARNAGLRVFPIPSRKLQLRRGVVGRSAAVVRLGAHAVEVRRLLSSVEPELVIAWGMRSAIATQLAIVASSAPPASVFQHHDLLPGPLVGRAVRAVAGRMTAVVAASRTVAEDLDPDGRLGSRMRVVHPGIDTSSFDVDQGIASPPLVLLLGALVEWKRPELALEAFAITRTRFPDARLLVAGAPIEDGEGLLARLRERASRPDLDGSVELTGEAADARALLAASTCLLHCAEREPFGLAIVEAMASGRPVVVPASGGPAEIADRSCAVLYRPGDARAAASALGEVLSDPVRAAGMGEAGRARATERFDHRRSRAEYADVVRPLLRSAEAADGVGGVGGVAIVTVTRNSAPELEAMLSSVDRHLPGARVVVVDNASDDGSVAIARAWSGSATVIVQPDNVGFGRACNRGLEEVQSDVTVLLNPDVELLDGSLGALADEVRRRDRLLAPLVLGADGSRQDSVHPVPASAAELLGAFLPPRALPGSLARSMAPWRATRPRRVGWAIGAALIARTETLRTLGPFDERIFLYGEDLDLCLRAAHAGIETWFWPSARVLHGGAHARDAAFGGEPYEVLARARRDVVAERLGPRRLHLDDALQALTFRSRRVLKLALGRPADRERLQLEALARARRAT